MLLQMILECGRLSERFVTIVTLVRMDTGVDTPMDDQTAAAGERFLTNFALYPLPGVEPRVHREGSRIDERFVTVFALKWPLAGVPPPVDDQMRGPWEYLRAELALIRSLFAVLTEMVLQLGG